MTNLHSTHWKQGFRSSDLRKRQKWRKWRVSLRQKHGLEKAGFALPWSLASDGGESQKSLGIARANSQNVGRNSSSKAFRGFRFKFTWVLPFVCLVSRVFHSQCLVRIAQIQITAQFGRYPPPPNWMDFLGISQGWAGFPNFGSFDQDTTRDRNLQFRAPSPLDFFLNLLQWIFPLSPCFMCDLVRKSPQDVEEIARFPNVEKSAESCHVSGCHGFCSVPIWGFSLHSS